MRPEPVSAAVGEGKRNCRSDPGKTSGNTKGGRSRGRALSCQKDHRGAPWDDFPGHQEDEKGKRDSFCGADPMLELESLTVL